MTEVLNNFLISLITIIANLMIIFGTGYVVFILGFCGWWFLLSVILLFGIKESKGKRSD